MYASAWEMSSAGVTAPEVQELTDLGQVAQLRAEWDALVTRTRRDEVFYRNDFIRLWIAHFGRQGKIRVLTLREGGQLTAVLPLIEERTMLHGVPVRSIHSASNPHSCRFDLIAVDEEKAASVFLDHLERSGGWDLLLLGDIPSDGKSGAWRMYGQAEARGFPVGTWESLQSPYIPLPPSMDALKLSSKFKANLRRRRRKLEESGPVTFERFTGGRDLEAKLEEGFALEQSGWKGKRGTAMAQDSKTRGFYSELARCMAYQDRLVLYFMRLQGRAVAFQFSLVHDDRYLILKPGYDETLQACSPGQLLMEEVVRDCITRGYRELDFLGPDMVWKRDWTSHVRPHHWLFVFSQTLRGRILHRAKFEWIPKTKHIIERLRRDSPLPV